MEKTVIIYFVDGTVVEHDTHMITVENGTVKIAIMQDNGKPLMRYYSLVFINYFDVK